MENNYQLVPLKTVLNIKKICTIHYFKYCKQFNFKGEKHNFWEMVYIDAGVVEVVADDKAFSLKQGEAIFHKPNEYHNIFTADNFANSVIISFECNSRAMNFFKNKILKFSEYERELLNKIIYERSQNYVDRLDDMYLMKLTQRKNAPFGGEQLIKNYIELLLLSLIRNNSTALGQKQINENIRTKHSNEIVENIIEILHNSVYKKINLDSIASDLFFSKTYIKNLFNKQTGTSIIQYYIKLKVDEAKKLISQNKYTFTEIAYMLNFNSVHYFSRLFKVHSGLSPSEYDKTIKIDKILK